MNIVVLTRLFEDISKSDCLVVDLDLCTTPDELKFKKEIEECIESGKEYLYNPSDLTIDIVCGRVSYNKICFLNGKKKVPVNGTICQGPVIVINEL